MSTHIKDTARKTMCGRSTKGLKAIFWLGGSIPPDTCNACAKPLLKSLLEARHRRPS